MPALETFGRRSGKVSPPKADCHNPVRDCEEVGKLFQSRSLATFLGTKPAQAELPKTPIPVTFPFPTFCPKAGPRQVEKSREITDRNSGQQRPKTQTVLFQSPLFVLPLSRLKFHVGKCLRTAGPLIVRNRIDGGTLAEAYNEAKQAQKTVAEVHPLSGSGEP